MHGHVKHSDGLVQEYLPDEDAEVEDKGYEDGPSAVRAEVPVQHLVVLILGLHSSPVCFVHGFRYYIVALLIGDERARGILDEGRRLVLAHILHATRLLDHLNLCVFMHLVFTNSQIVQARLDEKADKVNE